MPEPCFSAVDFEHNLIMKKVKLVKDGENHGSQRQIVNPFS